MIKSVCVFCASSTQIDKEYLSCAYDLGKIFALHGIVTVYGGGSIGSMGALADSVLQNGGKIIGVIPKFMMELEWGNSTISELIVVDTMADRKKKLIDNVDAIVALPGGTGTLEELAEVISLKKLGQFNKPIIIINTKGFYNYLLQFIDNMVRENFIRNEHQQIFSVIDKPDDVLNVINASPKWDSSAIKLAIL